MRLCVSHRHTRPCFRPATPFRPELLSGGGDLTTRLHVAGKQDQTTITAHTTLTAVALENIPELGRISGRALAGRLSGNVSWDSTQSAKSVTADLSVVAGRVELLIPWLAIKQVDFQRIDTALSLNRQRLLVKRCVFVGEQISGDLSGSIQLRSPLGKSLLTLTGTIRLDPDFFQQLQSKLPEGLVPEENQNGGYRVSFGGTLDKPMFSLK